MELKYEIDSNINHHFERKEAIFHVRKEIVFIIINANNSRFVFMRQKYEETTQIKASSIQCQLTLAHKRLRFFTLLIYLFIY